MGILSKDPEKQRAKEELAASQAETAAAAAFWESPIGRARAVYEAGGRWFQTDLTLSETNRTLSGIFSGTHNAMKRVDNYQGEVIQLIEDEGWLLEHAGFVFRQTGSVSREKALSSGAVGSVTGETIGIYLFRRGSK